MITGQASVNMILILGIALGLPRTHMKKAIETQDIILNTTA
jgi:hypothetical protein